MREPIYAEGIEIELHRFKFQRQAILKKSQQSLFDFMYLTGCRISEAVRALRPTDFNFEREEVTVKSLKQRGERTIKRTILFLPEDMDLINSVRLHVESTPTNSFVWKYSRQWAHRLCVKYFGTKDHSFRHTHATQLFRDYDLPEYQCRDQMGWSHINSSQPYVHYAALAQIRKKLKRELKPNEVLV